MNKFTRLYSSLHSCEIDNGICVFRVTSISVVDMTIEIAKRKLLRFAKDEIVRLKLNACKGEIMGRSGRHIALNVTNVMKHQKIDGFSMFEDPERFGQDVSGLRCGGDMMDVDFPEL